jgi:hypothetical protein
MRINVDLRILLQRLELLAAEHAFFIPLTYPSRAVSLAHAEPLSNAQLIAPRSSPSTRSETSTSTWKSVRYAYFPRVQNLYPVEKRVWRCGAHQCARSSYHLSSSLTRSKRRTSYLINDLRSTQTDLSFLCCMSLPCNSISIPPAGSLLITFFDRMDSG